MYEVIIENFECDLYIDADEDLSTLLQNIAKLFNTNISKNIVCVSEGEISLINNRNYHKIKKLNLEDGFLFYRYLLKAKPNKLFGEENAIKFISLILEYFWSNNCPAIAFCDYEENLPYQGGYKSPHVPIPK